MLARRRVLHRTPFEDKPPEQGSRRWLVAELDRLVSVIVRRRDRRCVTCGGARGLQCSHFYSRRYLRTRFDLRNCNAMCAVCNRRHNEDPEPYLKFMTERYGEEAVAELDHLRRDDRKVDDEELLRTLEWLRGGPVAADPFRLPLPRYLSDGARPGGARKDLATPGLGRFQEGSYSKYGGERDRAGRLPHLDLCA